jgi:hypothetical protein
MVISRQQKYRGDADAHFLNGGEPCVYVSHDADDGCWQFLAPDFQGEMSRALLVSLAQ